MIMNKKTKGYVVVDIGDRTKSLDECFISTTSSSNPGPITRSIFVIQKTSEDDMFINDGVVRYGQKIYI
jgi:hypothetical protein